MATAGQVSKAILQEILVHGSETELEASEFQDTIFAMNNYMTSIDANGIQLGYTVVDNLGDIITVPAGALQGIIANVAIMLAPQFGAEIPQGLALKAKTGLRAMRKLGVTLASMHFPGTLPLGSGNETTNNWDSEQHFFFNSESNDVSTETNQNIGLESST